MVHIWIYYLLTYMYKNGKSYLTKRNAYISGWIGNNILEKEISGLMNNISNYKYHDFTFQNVLFMYIVNDK